jgi:hypothetical protein
VAGVVRDHQGRPDIHRHRLRRYSTGPEDGYLILPDLDGVAEVSMAIEICPLTATKTAR